MLAGIGRDLSKSHDQGWLWMRRDHGSGLILSNDTKSFET